MSRTVEVAHIIPEPFWTVVYQNTPGIVNKAQYIRYIDDSLALGVERENPLVGG